MERDRIQKNEFFSRAVFHGFVLKRSFWYGYMDGKAIAFCEKPTADGFIKVYINEGEGIWNPYFIEKDVVEKRYPNFMKTA